MSTSARSEGSFSDRTALVIGVGGLGCPALAALAASGIGRVVLADDDLVDETNLHRQILFSDGDVGVDKLDAARGALSRRAPGMHVELARSRFLPENARALVRGADVVVEGSDNYATKFLAADACHIESRPVVHGAAVRWRATVWAVAPPGKPCYRCLFEDLPDGDAGLNCAEAGVMGPVVGLAGALMADLTLRVLAGDASATGRIHTYDGLADRLRAVEVSAREDCALCGARQTIFGIDEARYLGRSCAA